MLRTKHDAAYTPRMSKDLTPDKALIFRIVHRDNFPALLREGCHCRTLAKGKAYVDIGNQELIAKRMSREIPCGPGGTLADYVPFYFTPYTPMLYNIKTGYNGITKRPIGEIIILVSSLHKVKGAKIPFVFSDRHAYLKTALFSDNLADLKERIIWPTLQARHFRKDDLDRFEKYQAEALVHKHVPVSVLTGVVCYNDSVRAALQAEADARGVELKIIAQPRWYL
jgi:hypothetical protein